MTALHFELPHDLEAAEPPPVRDEVRLMVAGPGEDLVHTRFLDLADHLSPATCWWSTTPPRCPRHSPAHRADGGAVDLTSPPRTPLEPLELGGGGAERRPTAPAHGARRCRSPTAAARGSSRRT